MTPRSKLTGCFMVGALALTPACTSRDLEGEESGTDSGPMGSTGIPSTNCDYDGEVHEDGATFESADGCTELGCSEGAIFVISDQSSTLAGDLLLQTQSDLDGLECLREVSGSLIVGTANAPGEVTDLSTLSALHTVGVSIIVRNNPGLTALDGLDGLLTVGQDLVLQDNPALQDTGGISSALTVYGAVRVINQ